MGFLIVVLAVGVGVVALVLGTQAMAGSRLPQLTDGRWREEVTRTSGREALVDCHGRTFTVRVRTANQDLHGEVEVALATRIEAVRAGPVEGLGFKDVELVELDAWWLVYTGADRWRLLRLPFRESNPAMDDGPQRFDDRRRVRAVVDGHTLALGFRQIDGPRLDGILAGMAELADVLERALLAEWHRLGELGLTVDNASAAGSVDGHLVRAVPGMLTVYLREPLPFDEVGHIDHVEGHAIPDPVLGMLLAGRGALGALASPALVEPLLAVLHAYPGSRLLSDRVEMVLPDDTQLVERLRLALDLARALCS